MIWWKALDFMESIISSYIRSWKMKFNLLETLIYQYWLWLNYSLKLIFYCTYIHTYWWTKIPGIIMTTTNMKLTLTLILGIGNVKFAIQLHETWDEKFIGNDVELRLEVPSLDVFSYDVFLQVTLPPWPIYRRYPLKWAPSQDTSSTPSTSSQENTSSKKKKK